MFVIDRYLDRDADSLAEMWQASQGVWLGGFHRGVPMTPERIRQAESGSDHLLTLVARSDDRVIGYCSVRPRFGDSSATYVAELGVHPSYHGYGIGRDLLRHAIDDATRHRYRRVDLNTWAGNERALPLYERAGFLWVPGTSVLMENYLPTLLSEPLVQEFLEGQDWYDCLRQPVRLAPDEAFEYGRPIFRYHFRRDGRFLTAVIDRTSRGVFALFGDDWQIALSAPIATTPERVSAARLLIRLPTRAAGVPTMATLRLGSDVPSERSAVCVEALVTQLELPIEAPPVSAPSAATITALVSAAGQVTTLSATVVLAPLVSVELFQPEAAIVGVPQQVTVRIRNNNVQPARLQLGLTSTGAIAVSPRLQAVTLASGEMCDLPVQILASRPGVYEIGIGVIRSGHDEQVIQPVATFPIPVVDEFDSVAYQTSEAVVLENVHFRAQLMLAGGAIYLRDRATGVQYSQVPTLGPPASNSTLSNATFVGRYESTGTGWRAILTGEVPHWPGVRFERTVEIGASPVLRVQHRVHNRGLTDHVFSLSLSHGQLGSTALAVTTVVPLEAGLLVAEQPQFPDWRDGSPPLAENWLAHEYDGGAFGLIWPAGGDLRWEPARGVTLSLPQIIAPSQFERRFSDVTLYVGAGDWRAIRTTWQRHQTVPGEINSSDPPLGPLALLPSALPVVCLNGQGQIDAIAWSLAARPQEVQISASAPPGWLLAVTPDQVGLLDQSHPGNVRIAARSEAGRFADVGELLLIGEHDRSAAPVYLLDLGTSEASPHLSESTRNEQPIFEIDNQRFQVVVAPGFAGSAISFRQAGLEILKTAFPSPGRLPYCNPWFGGISPQIGPVGEAEPGRGGYLSTETLTASKVEGEEFLGQQLRGVRLSGTSSTVSDLQIAVEYLTLGNSPILLLVLELTNRARNAVASGVGWTVNLADHASDQPKWLRWREAWTGYRRCVPNSVEVIPADGWVIAGSGDDANGLALAAAPPFNALAIDLGSDGAHLGAFATIRVPPGRTIRAIAAVTHVERALEARVLAEILSRSAPALA